MIEINFKFKEKDNIIKCDIGRVFKEVCEEFAVKLKLDIDNIFFIYKGIKINLSKGYLVGQEFEIENEFEFRRIELLVYEENPFTIIFQYQGKNYLIGANEQMKMKDIYSKFSIKANMNLNNLYFIYNGEVFNEDSSNKVINDIINNIDREEKVMTILVNDLERNSSIVSMAKDLNDIKRESLLPKNDNSINNDNNCENNNDNNFSTHNDNENNNNYILGGVYIAINNEEQRSNDQNI